MADRSHVAHPSNDGNGWRRWLLIAAVILLALFCLLNSQKVRVHLIFTTVQMPLIIALVIAALLGALIGWALPRLRRSTD